MRPSFGSILGPLLAAALPLGAEPPQPAPPPAPPPAETSPFLWADRASFPTYIHPSGLIEVSPMLEPRPGAPVSSSMGYAVFHPQAQVAEHQHPESDEYLYFLSGSGKAVVGGREIEIHAGQALFIPRGVLHRFVNDGAEDAAAVQVYTPPGPEQRFKQWPRRVSGTGSPD